ncbi:unnamed protein product [Dimorphilus gyrociliatus]|uniref:Elongator complex protein 4 n=1 Tax=Dimorphilus gyrociliatus TaxID=2664684 RepID=A0A7I8VUU8_9ANNE|nr:unnamed protein product [Dimorphilus gyrociliatus]
MQSTSFQRRGPVRQIKGAKRSLYNDSLLISTGVPGIDSIIGGGLPLGTILLVEEDETTCYGDVIERYFIAEGVVNQHRVIIADTIEKPSEILSKLPSIIETNTEADVKEDKNSKPDLKIAWRYENSQKGGGKFVDRPTRFGNYYDLSETMDITGELKPNLEAVDFSDVIDDDKATTLIERLIKLIETPSENASRVLIRRFARPFWGNLCSIDICKFLLKLRNAIRGKPTSILLTIPMHIYEDDSNSIRNFVDFALELNAVRKDKKVAGLADYHGCLRLRKSRSPYSLHTPQPDTSDWAFKQRRTKFVVERMHLPPDLGENASRGKEESDMVSQKKKLEF